MVVGLKLEKLSPANLPDSNSTTKTFFNYLSTREQLSLYAYFCFILWQLIILSNTNQGAYNHSDYKGKSRNVVAFNFELYSG